MKNKNHFPYIAVASAVCAAVLLSAIAINVIVDPYDMYHLFEIKGVNINKPAVYTRVRLLKAYEVRRLKAEAVVLGSSRCHLGFNPENSLWAAQFEKRYNLAFDGATTKEMYFYLKHADAVHPLEQVILCLDTYHPTDAPGSVRPGFEQDSLLSGNNMLSRIKVFLHDLKLLISWDTLKNSLETWKSQYKEESRWLSPNGQRLGEVFFRRSGENFQKFGPRYYFDEIDRNEVGYKLEWKIPQKPMPKIYPPPAELAKDLVTSLGYIEKIIDHCRIRNIDLKIIFSPSHVHQLELEAETNGWWSLNNSKRKMTEILAQDAQRYPGRPSIPLWDFSGYSVVTMEPLPPVGSFEEMNFYWDSSHFKDNVGDMVFEKVLSPAKTGDDVLFGVLLTTDNVEAFLAEMLQDQTEYQVQHPEDIVVIRTWVDEYRKKHHLEGERP